MAPVLVTNDDGVHAPGLLALAAVLHKHGVDIVVAAPLNDRSGSGAAIGPLHVDGGVAFERVELDGLEGVPTFGVDGPPALAVMAARLGGFGDVPEIVFSGINPGCNTGRAVLHSGTVGAALTAANLGGSGLAVSIDAGEDLCWETAGEIAAGLLPWLVAAPAKTVLNVNVPNLALGELAGVRWATIATFGTVRAALVESDHGRLQMELRVTDARIDPESDTGLVRAGYAAVSRLVGIRAVAPEPGDERDPVAELDRHLASRR